MMLRDEPGELLVHGYSAPRSTSPMAPVGHVETQRPHPKHLDLSY